MFVPRPKKKRTSTKTVSKTFTCIGVDFRSDQTAIYHSPDSVNMYRSQSGEWETHPGFRVIGTKTGEHYSVFRFRYLTGEKVLIHIGTKLYTWNNYPVAYTAANLTEIYSGMPARICKYIVFTTPTDIKLLILGGGVFIVYDGSTASDIADSAFIPQTWQSKSPDASAGTVYQQRNLIQPGFIEGFTGDGTATYQLSMTNLDATAITATVDGVAKVEGTHFTVNRTTGILTWTAGNFPPNTTGRESVKITAYKTESGYLNMIMHCTEALVFDNRLFITGNPDYPNRIFWTGFQEPSYFGEVMYNDRAGSGSIPITALQLLSSDAFLALKKSTAQDGSYSVIYPQDLDDENNPKTYVARQGSGTVGCLNRESSRVFLDDNVYMSTTGLSAISRELNISNERNIEHRSTMVDPKLLLEDVENCVCEEYENRLYVLCPSGHCYMADAYLMIEAGAVSQYSEYRWAYLEGLGVYLDGGVVVASGGTFDPANNIQTLGDHELYLCCNGYLLKFNFDLTRLNRSNELKPDAYYYNGRHIGDYYKPSFDWLDKTNYIKRLISGHNDLLVSVRIGSKINITWRTEKGDGNKTLELRSQGVSYSLRNYADCAYGALPQASFVLKKLKPKNFRRIQLKVASAAGGCCVAFQSLTLEAELLDNDLR
jgi:hypothetical protein